MSDAIRLIRRRPDPFIIRGQVPVCEQFNDVAAANLIASWIDETEHRTWFLAEITGVE